MGIATLEAYDRPGGVSGLRTPRQPSDQLEKLKTGRSAGLDLAVVRLCGTQQTIYFSTGNHDPSALSNRFDCAPVELAVSPGLMFPK
jgi:hypothetical protein